MKLPHSCCFCFFLFLLRQRSISPHFPSSGLTQNPVPSLPSLAPCCSVSSVLSFPGSFAPWSLPETLLPKLLIPSVPSVFFAPVTYQRDFLCKSQGRLSTHCSPQGAPTRAPPPVHPHPQRRLPLSLGSSEGDRCPSWDSCIPIAYHVVCRIADLNVS